MSLYQLDDVPPELAGHEIELLTLGATVLSRYVADSNSRRFSHLRTLGRLLVRYEDPEEGPTRRARMSSAEVALRRLGSDCQEMRDAWQRAKARDRLRARLPYEVLLALFPTPLWTPLLRFITDGPDEAAAQVESVLLFTSLSEVAPTRARPTGGRVSRLTLRGTEGSARRLMGLLYLLHGKYPSSHLDAWQGVRPQIHVPDAPMANTDRSAPPLGVVRQRLRRFNADVARILDPVDGDEAAAVLRLPEWKMYQGLFRLLRDRTVFVLAVLLGARIEALADLTRGSIVEPSVRLDGSFGATVKLYPGKTLSQHECRPKPIPDPVYELVRTYIVFLERRLGRPMLANEPLLVPGLMSRRQRVPAESQRETERSRPAPLEALATADAGSHEGPRGSDHQHHPSPALPRYAPGSLSKRFSGGERNRNSPALLPKDPSQPYVGHSAHTMRHLAEQLVKRGAGEYCERHGMIATPQAVADALLDHDAVDSDRFGYSDMSSHVGRIRLAGVGTTIIWSYLSTDAGAPRRPDVEAFKEAVLLRASVQAELAEQRRRQEIHEAGLPALTRDVEAGRASVSQLVSAVSRDSAYMRELLAIRDRLDQCEREIHALRHDRKTWVVLDDGSRDGGPVDLDVIEAETLAGVVDDGFGALPAVRQWVTVSEFAYICSLSASQAREWVRGRHLPFAQGDPRRPWEPDTVPVNRTLGERRQRIILSHVAASFWDSDAKCRRRDEVLADWPTSGRWPQEYEPPIAPHPLQALVVTA